ncbi:hypothetical protein J6590_091506 [Homalodisca vitripennis]|nr:hypothetical protein J6590_091506 [Homalodisca vitripennis]
MVGDKATYYNNSHHVLKQPVVGRGRRTLEAIKAHSRLTECCICLQSLSCLYFTISYHDMNKLDGRGEGDVLQHIFIISDRCSGSGAAPCQVRSHGGYHSAGSEVLGCSLHSAKWSPDERAAVAGGMTSSEARRLPANVPNFPYCVYHTKKTAKYCYNKQL